MRRARLGLARPLAAAVVGAALLAACGDDGDPAETGEPPAPTTTEATTTTAEATTTTSATTSSTGQVIGSDPADAAEAFLAAAFPGSASSLGELQQGDSQSGELPVFRPGEGGGTDLLAATLLLRLGPADAWEVIGAVNEFVTIEAPENASEVPAGPLTISGVGRGFEATLNVRVLRADGTQVGETAIASGGAFAEPEPYEATVDLSTATPGEQLYVVVNGGTGLDDDTGEFAAVRITVG